MDTTIVNLVNGWTTRLRNTGYPVSAGNPTGNLGMRLEKAGAAGVIVSNFANPLSGAWGTYTVYDTKNKSALGIAMSCEDYGLLYRITEHKQGPRSFAVNAVTESLGEVPMYATPSVPSRARKSRMGIHLAVRALSLIRGTAHRARPTTAPATILMMEAMRIPRKPHILIPSVRSWSGIGPEKNRG